MPGGSRSDTDRRSQALALAARLRAVRAEVLEDVRSGSRTLSDVLMSRDPFEVVIKVVAIVENVPSVGKVRARRIADDIGITGDCKIRDLTPHHIEALLDRVPR